MSDKSKIEWTDATWQTITAAKRIGISESEYVRQLSSGKKWCTACRDWHPRDQFGKDASRGDGLASKCLASKRCVTKRAAPTARKKRGWMAAVRDGDKKQARRRINYLVETKAIPHPDDLPCVDCLDEIFLNTYRHEYDHARGYDGENQFYVEPVCSRCHHNREQARHG
jgi:hypothetical protein